MKKLSTTVANTAHDLMFDYIKETAQGLFKISINRIRRTSVEKGEWDALKAFEDVATEHRKCMPKPFLNQH